MNYDTYIINLDKDKLKLKNISNNLDNLDIKYTRYNAIYGKNINNEYDNLISKYKDFIPQPIIGCALSHYLCGKEHFDNDNNNIALILEDDAEFLIQDKKELDNVLKNAPVDWNIILLYSQGFTNYSENTWQTSICSGSTIGYFINKKGFEKLYKDFKIFTHIDVQRIILQKTNPSLKVYKTPKPLIKPNIDTESNTSSKSNTYRKFIEKFIDDYFYESLETKISLLEEYIQNQ